MDIAQVYVPDLVYVAFIFNVLQIPVFNFYLVFFSFQIILSQESRAFRRAYHIDFLSPSLSHHYTFNVGRQLRLKMIENTLEQKLEISLKHLQIYRKRKCELFFL